MIRHNCPGGLAAAQKALTSPKYQFALALLALNALFRERRADSGLIPGWMKGGAVFGSRAAPLRWKSTVADCRRIMDAEASQAPVKELSA
jgi:hypothetical protein